MSLVQEEKEKAWMLPNDLGSVWISNFHCENPRMSEQLQIGHHHHHVHHHIQSSSSVR